MSQISNLAFGFRGTGLEDEVNDDDGIDFGGDDALDNLTENDYHFSQTFYR